MQNPVELEKAYQKYSEDLSKWIPDGIITVNLSLLHEMGILKEEQKEPSDEDEECLSHYFHVIETEEKVTLFNDQFVIWITPQIIEETPTTLTMIALMQDSTPKLEAVFSSSGVYNSPKYILRVLQHFLKDTLDTENIISSIEKASGDA